MIAIQTKVIEKAIKLFDSNIKSQKLSALKKLKEVKNTHSLKLSNEENIYLDKVISLFANHDIITESPSSLKKRMREIGSAPKPKIVSESKDQPINLTNEIQRCLNYEILRNTFYPQFFQKVGIKACVYCNSQLTIVIDKDDTKKKLAKFQLDHHHNKAEFPFLSISLYNLYPVCANCNLIKGQKEIEFTLYSEKNENSMYEFKLADGVVAKYLSSYNIDDIEILFVDPTKSQDDNNQDDQSLKGNFSIEEIYNTQKDIVEEIILKKQMYNDIYKQSLCDNFESLFPTTITFERLILGNYTEPTEIHKRPMSKFMQDIARTVGLLKKDI